MERKGWLFILSIALLFTVTWSVQNYQRMTRYQKRSELLQLHVENTYQRAFYDLVEQLDGIHNKFGTTLAMNSRKSLSPALADVWRVSDEARMSLSQLPLRNLPFNETETFLNDIEDFAYRVSVRDLDKTPLTEQEYQTLANLYKRSGEIAKKTKTVQDEAFDQQLKWVDVETILANTKQETNGVDNSIVDGLRSIEKSVSSYTSNQDFGPDFSSTERRDKSFKNVTGKDYTETEAIMAAKRFTGIDKPNALKITSNLAGSKYGFYSITFKDPQTNDDYSIDLTKKGGHPIYFMNNRQVEEENFGLEEAAEKAEVMMARNGYTDLELIESAQYDEVALFTFVRVVNGVRVYPDNIRLKVALDTNQVIAVAADAYFENTKARDNWEIKVTEAEARTRISKNLTVEEHRLALIRNNLEQEVVCHEFLGTLQNNTYRIFINAQTGEEEFVEKLNNSDVV